MTSSLTSTNHQESSARGTPVIVIIVVVVVILAVFLPTVIVVACVAWKCKKNKLSVQLDSKEPIYHEIGKNLRDNKDANNEKPENNDLILQPNSAYGVTKTNENHNVLLQPNSAYGVTKTNERHNELNTLEPNSDDGATENQ